MGFFGSARVGSDGEPGVAGDVAVFSLRQACRSRRSRLESGVSPQPDGHLGCESVKETASRPNPAPRSAWLPSIPLVVIPRSRIHRWRPEEEDGGKRNSHDRHRGSSTAASSYG